MKDAVDDMAPSFVGPIIGRMTPLCAKLREASTIIQASPLLLAWWYWKASAAARGYRALGKFVESGQSAYSRQSLRLCH